MISIQPLWLYYTIKEGKAAFVRPVTKVKYNCQDTFLQQMRRDKVGVIVYLVNGYQLKGNVRGYDNFTLFLENEGKIQMVYKHAITTISPVKPVRIFFQPPQDGSCENEACECHSEEQENH